jgi:hypothetical protein
MAAVDAGTPEATTWAAQRNQVNAFLLPLGGSYTLAALTGPRGGYPTAFGNGYGY